MTRRETTENFLTTPFLKNTSKQLLLKFRQYLFLKILYEFQKQLSGGVAAVRKCSSEAVTQRCSAKKRFLEILENSQESTCESLFINKVAGQGWQHYLKRAPGKGVSCEFCKIWKNNWQLLLVLQNGCSYKLPDIIHQKISVLKSLFDTVRSLKACNFNKKETSTQVFCCEYHKIPRNSCFIEQLQWLLLNMVEEFLRISNSSRYLHRRIYKREICKDVL